MLVWRARSCKVLVHLARQPAALCQRLLAAALQRRMDRACESTWQAADMRAAHQPALTGQRALAPALGVRQGRERGSLVKAQPSKWVCREPWGALDCQTAKPSRG